MEIPQLLVHQQADMASILLQCGTGKTPFTSGAGAVVGSPTPTFLGNDVHKAAEMAEAMTDDQIRGTEGVRNMFKFFDDHPEPYQQISGHENFERAVYGNERSSHYLRIQMQAELSIAFEALLPSTTQRHRGARSLFFCVLSHKNGIRQIA